MSSVSSTSIEGSSRSSSPAPSISSRLSEPDILLPAVRGPLVWQGKELDSARYVYRLTDEDIVAIRANIVKHKLTGLPTGSINRYTFHLPEHATASLTRIRNQVIHGQGVAVLRGLDTAKLNDEEGVIAFVGLAAHVCSQRATDDYANQTLSHVHDVTDRRVPEWAKDIGLAGSKLPTAMEFHSDRFSGDVLALYVRDDGGADSGGEQFVASFWQIYNELLENDPAVLETMAAADWPFELKQKNSAPYLDLGPTLFFADGKPICQLVKAPLVGGAKLPRSESMPSLTAEQLHALAAVEQLAQQFCTKIDRQSGDIQFINNLGVMHARAAYDHGRKRSTRHLLRMFLRDHEEVWAKPASYATRFGNVFGEGREENFPIVDMDPWRKISGRESHG
ncbi:Clavaminate synthase-like protein [Polyplosphaeria fusca]|uniref:Clavaminate synthase-like protein n=1 Tax=Polyplosphaeria fusca TaxID=682080 RepID=A0A9P4R8K0_9PLEO|nr:Clavaminate synthase-like protein [Polyplosphaeria fusca]